MYDVMLQMFYNTVLFIMFTIVEACIFWKPAPYVIFSYLMLPKHVSATIDKRGNMQNVSLIDSTVC